MVGPLSVDCIASIPALCRCVTSSALEALRRQLAGNPRCRLLGASQVSDALACGITLGLISVSALICVVSLARLGLFVVVLLLGSGIRMLLAGISPGDQLCRVLRMRIRWSASHNLAGHSCRGPALRPVL